jgi:WD40 repeat protein/tRNA A-37 threonylcarbamoyl transferase component Bud32
MNEVRSIPYTDPSFEQLLADCFQLAAVERPDRDRLLAANPEHAEAFREFIDDLDWMRHLVGAAPKAEPQACAPAPEDGENTVDDSSREGPITQNGAYHANRLGLFGDYELLEEVARGAMGVVFKARQLSLNRIVAVKMILSGQFASDEDVQRFHGEARAAAHLRHPGIVPVYEIGNIEGRRYYSMGFVDGVSLNVLVRDDAVPAPREAAELVRRVAGAIHYAHERGVIHRDLKPANILMEKSDRDDAMTLLIAGQRGRLEPRITDFGLAKKLDAGVELTGTGQVLGTPTYMAPEQAAGQSGLIGPASDVYSLGALLYCLLTGHPPFRSATVVDTLQQVIHNDPIPPRQVNAAIPRDLETICLKCLKKDPKQRYQSADDLAADLRRWLDGKPIQARPVSAAARACMWCRRNRTAAAFLVVLFLFGGFSTGQWLYAQGLLHSAQRSACLTAIDEATELCRRREVGHGLLKFAQALRDAPSRSEDLKHAIRANIVAWTPYAMRLKAILPHKSQVYFASYSPDGKTILTLSSGGGVNNGDSPRPIKGEARLWRSATGQPVGGPLSHGPAILWAAFSPDSQILATCGNDGMIRLWEVGRGVPLGNPMKHDGPVTCAAFSPDGRTLLTGGHDWTARFWDVQTRMPIGEPLPHPHWVTHVGFRPGPEGGVAITGCEDGAVRLWNESTHELISEQPQIYETRSDRRPVRLVAFSGDGTRLITNRPRHLSPEHGARLWDGARGDPIGPDLDHGGKVVRAVALSREGGIALTGGEDRTARSWHASTGKRFGPPLRHQDTVRALALSDDGTLALTGSEDGIAQVWDVEKGKPVGDPLRHQACVLDVAFHPLGHEFLTTSEDGTTRIWSLPLAAETAAQPISKATLEDRPAYLAYSPDGRRMLVGETGGTARVRDVETGIEAGEPLKLEYEVHAVDWSRNGQTLLTGSTDGIVRIWSAKTRALLREFLAHERAVRSAAFSPDGLTVLTGGEDRTAQLWDARTGKPIGPRLDLGAVVIAVAFGPDGQSLLAGTEDHVVRRWQRPLVPPGSDELFDSWAEFVTGTRIEEGGTFRALDEKTWQRYRERLRLFGKALGSSAALVPDSGSNP